MASAEGGAGDLTRVAAAQFGGAAARLLYLAGEDRAADLAAALGAHDAAVHTVVVYRMAAAELLPAEIATALSARRIDGVLHYSRRSAQTYLRCAVAAGLGAEAAMAAHYCLSAESAAPLVGRRRRDRAHCCAVEREIASCADRLRLTAKLRPQRARSMPLGCPDLRS